MTIFLHPFFDAPACTLQLFASGALHDPHLSLFVIGPVGLKTQKEGLVIISPISPGVETPGYFLPSLRDCESPVRATDNNPAIHCRVGEVRPKPPFSYALGFER